MHGVCLVFSFYAVFAFQNVSCEVQKLKGKHVFMKNEIFHVWHIASSVAHKQNTVDFNNSSCKKTMLSNVCYQKSNFASQRVIGILKT